jgi:hypothetical protein
MPKLSLEIWEPQPPGTLRVCPGLQRDCFAFYISTTQHFGLLLSVGLLSIISPFSYMYSLVHVQSRGCTGKMDQLGATVSHRHVLKPLRGCKAGSDHNEDTNTAHDTAHETAHVY